MMRCLAVIALTASLAACSGNAPDDTTDTTERLRAENAELREKVALLESEIDGWRSLCKPPGDPSPPDQPFIPPTQGDSP